MSRNVEESLLDIDFASLTRRPFTPSPAAWEDQVLYFLMLDRFSDGNENGGYADAAGRPVHTGATPLYRPEADGLIEYDTWFGAAGGWQGGTIKGLAGKLGYLRRLGVTALWVSPPFRQVTLVRTLGAAGLPGCGGDSGCAGVLASRWSRLGPVPVSVLGATLYLVCLISALFHFEIVKASVPFTNHVLLISAICAGGAAAWFVALQLVVIRRFCFYCTTAHALATIAAVLIITRPGAGHSGVSAVHWGAAGAMLATLILGQLVLEPKLYSLERASEPTAIPLHSPSSVVASQLSPSDSSANSVTRVRTGRTVSL